jgi:hypothetical protein
MENIRNFLWFYGSFSAKIACIWLSVWLIRKKAEADYPLDRSAHLVRWTVILAGFGVGYYLQDLWYLRIGGRFLGLVFLCWPNFAYRLVQLFRRNDTAQKVV